MPLKVSRNRNAAIYRLPRPTLVHAIRSKNMLQLPKLNRVKPTTKITNNILSVAVFVHIELRPIVVIGEQVYKTESFSVTKQEYSVKEYAPPPPPSMEDILDFSQVKLKPVGFELGRYDEKSGFVGADGSKNEENDAYINNKI